MLKVTRAAHCTPFEGVFRNEGNCLVSDLKSIRIFANGEKMSFFLEIVSQTDGSKRHLLLNRKVLRIR
jgi:hypothetical protein